MFVEEMEEEEGRRVGHRNQGLSRQMKCIIARRSRRKNWKIFPEFGNVEVVGDLIQLLREVSVENAGRSQTMMGAESLG